MSDLGFWNLATHHPDHIALVTPAGTGVRAGDLLVRSNQLVHGLRQLGLAQGDVVATLLPNGAEMIELYLAACERSRAVVAEISDLDALSVVPDRRGAGLFSLRWIMTHMIEETARHNGHADLLREAIDGLTGE